MNAPSKLALIIAGLAIAIPQSATIAKGLDAKAWSGTWKLNSEKSKFSSPDYTPKSETRSYVVSGNRVTMRSNMVTAAGKAVKWGYAAAANGKWYPVSGNPGSDRVKLTMAGARALKSETTLKGKAASHSTLSVSGDGKELTVNRSLVTKDGPTDDTVVYDRTK